MRTSVVRALLSLSVSAGVAWIAWRLGGPIGLAFGLLLASPLAAFGIAPLLIAAVGESAALARRIAYRDLNGRHVVYKGRALDVREDLTGDRWIRVADVRKLLPGFPRDRVLQQTMPDVIGLLHPPKTLRISASGLDAYLARNTDPAAVRFRVWLQRELIDPAERVRRRGVAGQIRIDPLAPALNRDPSPAADR
ncbi:MAG: hypothetical protein ABIN96_10840 [Rubrivivax sp.]